MSVFLKKLLRISSYVLILALAAVVSAMLGNKKSDSSSDPERTSSLIPPANADVPLDGGCTDGSDGGDTGCCDCDDG